MEREWEWDREQGKEGNVNGVENAFASEAETIHVRRYAIVMR